MPQDQGNQTQIQQAMDRQKREIEAAHRISEALFRHQDTEALVEEALNTALTIVEAQAGAVLLANPETEELVFFHTIGEKGPKPGSTIPWTKGIAGSVFQSGEPLICGDVHQDSRHFGKIDEATGFRTNDMIALPLKRLKGDPIGVLEVLNKREGELGEQDLEILTIISAFTAVSLEQARLFQEAKVAEVARMLGDIGHDIKNMLMPVLNGGWLLRDELDEHFAKFHPAAAKDVRSSETLCNDIIQMIDQNARRIQDRVKEIADAVKGVTSPPQFGSCRISEIVDAVSKALHVIAKEKEVIIWTGGLGDLPVIQADERRLFNAFYNLINNAIPEVSTGGTITIRGRLDDETRTVVLTIADNGRGMPPKVRDSLFTSKAVSTKPGGTGLGTKIVKDVVAAHGGSISVESQEGVGTTFHIRLPLQQTEISTSEKFR